MESVRTGDHFFGACPCSFSGMDWLLSCRPESFRRLFGWFAKFDENRPDLLMLCVLYVFSAVVNNAL
jgi:hypothetical protein